MSRVLNGLLIVLALALITGCANQQARDDKASKRKLAETQVQLGIGYMQQGKMEVARDKLLQAIETDSKYAVAHNAIAILYTQLGQTEQADSHYSKAVSLDPKDANAQNNYGAFLCDQQRYAEAYKHFEAAVKNPLYRTPERAYENAGLCALREPNLDYAEQSLRKALHIQPRLVMSLVNMADVLYQKASYLPARAYIQRYEEVARHSPQSLWLAIQIEQALEDNSRAQQYQQQLREQFPDSEQVQQLNKGNG